MDEGMNPIYTRDYLKNQQKQKIKADIEHLVCWLEEKRNIDVCFARDNPNEYWYEEKIICVNTRQNYRSQLHTLLHEAGHANLMYNKKRYSEKFPMFSTVKGRSGKSKAHLIETLREEVEAWNEGLRIASRIGIDVDKKWYFHHQSEALYTYVKWIGQ
jgi:hypothetical protein